MTDLTEPIAVRREATAALGTALRSVIVAQCSTEVPVHNLREATALAGRIEALLVGQSRPVNVIASVDDLGASVRYFSPVTGLGNPMSPPLVFDLSASGGVLVRTTLDQRFEGPSGFVHGGVTGLLLDEVLGQAGTQAGRWGMTAYLNITYRQALPLGVELELSAAIESIDGRKTFVSGGIALASDPAVKLVEASALFIEPRAALQETYFGELTDHSGSPASARHGRDASAATSN
jgi:acyl-coenzyme A thioesterase PaaI-like protein